MMKFVARGDSAVEPPRICAVGRGDAASKPRRRALQPIIGLAFYSAAGDESLKRMRAAEISLRALGYEVDWVGDPLAVAKRLVEGRRWDFLYALGDGDLWSDRRWHVLALGDMFGQRIVDSGLTPIGHREGLGAAMSALAPRQRRTGGVSDLGRSFGGACGEPPLSAGHKAH